MFAEVIGAHESLVANRAGEPFLSRVCPQVTLELVRSCESFPAEKPIADERTLARVRSDVDLKSRVAAKDFATVAASVLKQLILFATGAATRRSTRAVTSVA